MAEGRQVPWPAPPREPGPWGGGPPVAPPGNTPLPPLPGAGGTMHTAAASTNPWATAGASPAVAVPRAVNQNPFPGLTQRPPLVDRAPGWVMGLSIAVVLALVAGIGYVVVKGGSRYPDEWDPRVAPIARWVERARDLTYEHPVEVEFLTAEEYTAASGGDEAEATPTAESKQQTADEVAQLRALGFLSGDLDLEKAVRTLNDSGSLAFYSPDSKKVYVRGTKMTPGLRVTLAHELVHVLQDQHFDLTRVSDLDGGRGSVLRALAEGDAGRIEDQYAEEVLTDAERLEYEKESNEESDAAQEKLEKEVPPILTTVFAAPYILGPELVDYVHAVDEAKGIDQALDDPPTEEVLFNPTLWKSEGAEPVEVTIEPPSGAEVIDQGEFGPTTWYLLLATRTDPKQALQATDGWGGDQYVVYKDAKDRVCVDMNASFDTTADRDQFHTTASAWVKGSPAGTATVESKGELERFHSCDPGKDAKPVGNKVGPELLALPSIRTAAYQGAISAGQSKEQAACYGQGIVDAFTLQQLTDDQYLGSPAGQQAIAAVRTRCA